MLEGDPEIRVSAPSGAGPAASRPFADEAAVLIVSQEPLWRALLDDILGQGGGSPGPILLCDDEAEQRFLASRAGGRGAWAALPAAVTAAELRLAVHAVAGGLAVVHPSLLPLLLSDLPDPGEEVAALSERERGVLDLLSKGFSNPEIARLLGISEHTVKFHTSAVYAKLGVANRTEAVRAGIRAGAIHL